MTHVDPIINTLFVCLLIHEIHNVVFILIEKRVFFKENTVL